MQNCSKLFISPVPWMDAEAGACCPPPPTTTCSDEETSDTVEVVVVESIAVMSKQKLRASVTDACGAHRQATTVAHVHPREGGAGGGGGPTAARSHLGHLTWPRKQAPSAAQPHAVCMEAQGRGHDRCAVAPAPRLAVTCVHVRDS
jgi:hypothetical protein